MTHPSQATVDMMVGTVQGLSTTDAQYVEAQLNKMEIKALIGMHSSRLRKLSDNVKHPEILAEAQATLRRVSILAQVLDSFDELLLNKQGLHTPFASGGFVTAACAWPFDGPAFVVDHVGSSYGQGMAHSTSLFGHCLIDIAALQKGTKLYLKP